MILYSRVTEHPTSFPISLEELRAELKVEGTEEDSILRSKLIAAIKMCESYAGLSFMAQTRTIRLDSFNTSNVTLPYGPVTSVESIAYVDEDDQLQSIDSSAYSVDTQSGISKIRTLDEWPGTNRTLNNVVITYKAGYEDAADVPPQVKEAIKRRVAFLFDNRGDQKVDEDTVWMDLLDTVKVYWDAEH